MRLIEQILDNINDLTPEQIDYIAYGVQKILNFSYYSRRHFKKVFETIKIPLFRVTLIQYVAEDKIRYAEKNTKNIEYRLAFKNSKLVEKFEHFKILHQSVHIAEIKTLLKEYRDATEEEGHYDTKLDDLFYFANLSFSEYVECSCGYCCNCVSSGASTRFEEEQKAAEKEIKTQMKQHKKAKQHLSKMEKQFEALIKQLSEPNQEVQDMKIAN